MLTAPSPLQHVVVYRGNFGDWAVRNAESLFLPKRENEYSLDAILHTLVKRLGNQSYESYLMMPEETRDDLFERELKLMEEEARTNKQN